jgi:hypothetical protein
MGSEPASLHERIARALNKDGAWCGDCEFESWDACSECRRVCGDYATAVLLELGLERVAMFRDYPLGAGADWIDALGQKIEHSENPHDLDDGTPLYRIREANDGE